MKGAYVKIVEVHSWRKAWLMFQLTAFVVIRSCESRFISSASSTPVHYKCCAGSSSLSMRERELMNAVLMHHRGGRRKKNKNEGSFMSSQDLESIDVVVCLLLVECSRIVCLPIRCSSTLRSLADQHDRSSLRATSLIRWIIPAYLPDSQLDLETFSRLLKSASFMRPCSSGESHSTIFSSPIRHTSVRQ